MVPKTGSIGGVLVCPRGDADPGSLLLWGATCEHAQVCGYLDNEAGKSFFLKSLWSDGSR